MSALPPATMPLVPAVNATISPPSPTVATAALTPSVSDTPPPPASGMSKEALTALVLGIVLGGVIVLVAVGVFVFFYKRSKKKKKEDQSLLPKQGQDVCSSPARQSPTSSLHSTSIEFQACSPDCFLSVLDNSFAGQAQKYCPNAPPPINNVVHQQSNSDPSPGLSSNVQPPPQVAVAPIPPSAGNSLGSEKSQLPQPPGIPMPLPNSTFTFEELALATDNFSSTNLLGQGGFGYVHKGFLPNGKEVAVKQLKSGSNQGEREFQAEVETISRVHHRHLVSLVGYCISEDQRMLVYEYIPNKTLEFHLHGVGQGRPPLSWATRLKIALGAAKGLAYLHEDCQPKIIHRDIKAANILLDNDFEAKVADFGLAKFSFDTDTHVSTRVMGTFGYLAPEYASSGKLTEKSDVFSFGVVLLELITGRRPVDKSRPFLDDSMVEWVRTENFSLSNLKLLRSFGCSCTHIHSEMSTP
ncbi:hypothetical protein Cgig2_020524 [Carnegiea gigantea]|uniref:non-specific serine/threonine protein kinase n=1 Tax=Carnegiea gigantea TaxID=171969 RepID=A0A9Q1K9Q3_9CARY|nr:hypothetical protein Cgig2_020524 [Carnegiea gigantea]